jgi:hypothetical protein
MHNGRDGFSPLGLDPVCLHSCEEGWARSRSLEPNESFRVDELFVPKYLRKGRSLVLVTAFGYEGPNCDPVNRLLSPDPVPIEAFAEYPLESFVVSPGQRVFVKLRNAAQYDIDIMLAVRGLYQRFRDA